MTPPAADGGFVGRARVGDVRLLEAVGREPFTLEAAADALDCRPPAVRRGLSRLQAGGIVVAGDPFDDRLRVVAVPAYGLGVVDGLEPPLAVEYHRTLDSTHERARALAARGCRAALVLAGEQGGGRGRRDRGWVSPPGGVYCSLALETALDPARVPLLGLAAGVAAVDAARALGVDAAVKWPNDVVRAGSPASPPKLAGVLTAAATAKGAVRWAVVSVGANVSTDPGRLPDGAASMQAGGGSLRAFVQRLVERFDRLRADPDRILDAWRASTATLGRSVIVETDDGTICGTAVDVDGTGALLVDTGAGTERVTEGECRHLRPE